MSTIRFFFILILITGCVTTQAQEIKVAGQPGQLDIRSAGENSIRITLKPLSFKDDFPFNPALAERDYPKSIISIRNINKTVKKSVGNLNITVSPNPLTIIISNKKGKDVQHLVFTEDGKLFNESKFIPWRVPALAQWRNGKNNSVQPQG